MGRDIIQESIIENPITSVEKFCNCIYTHVKNHRDLFGYPVGSENFPYLYVTNDLCGKFVSLLKMVDEHAHDQDELRDIMRDVPNMIELLLATYHSDTSNGSCSCCHFWHSMKREDIEKLQASI